MNQLSYEEASDLLKSRGWSDDAADFIATRRDDPKAIPLLKRLGANIKLPHLIKTPKTKIPDSIRWTVWERDNFTCRNCGSRRYLSVDHIVPESKGGTLGIDNLQTLCSRCNSSKGAR